MDKTTSKQKNSTKKEEISGIQSRNILFVSGPYQLHALKTDIQADSMNITTAASVDEAATLLQQTAFDLIFVEAGALKDADTSPAKTLKTVRPGVPVIILASPALDIPQTPNHNIGNRTNKDTAAGADHQFIWNGTPEMFHAMVRFIDDQYSNDTRQVVLLVEDSIEYTSFLLPAVYREIDAACLDIPPRLILADSHDTAMARIPEFGSRLACVLSDTRLPRQGKLEPEAGIDILSAIHREYPAIPMMLMSAESENRKKAGEIPASFLDKNILPMAPVLHEFFNNLTTVNGPAQNSEKQAKNQFPRFTDDTGMTRIGQGSMGGKARGISLLAGLLNRNLELTAAYPEMAVNIPSALVLCTDIYESFVRDNNLAQMIGHPLTKLVQAFIDAPLPEEVVRQLEDFLATTATPLAVRSSSLLEDAGVHPCAGLYKTYMIPNNHTNLQTRLGQLSIAVKLVYASTCYKKAKAFVHNTTARPFEDSMAVIIQETAGRRYGDYFYPALSGTAQSVNFYPAAGAKAEDGILHLAMGLGHTLAQGETCFRVSPKHPQSTPQFATARDFLDKTQNEFYSLKMADYPDTLHFGICANLERRNLTDAQEDAPLKVVSSTYVAAEDRIRDTWYCQGPKLITFARILKHDTPRLAALVKGLTDALVKETGGPVEMEFAANIPETPDGPWEISLLQARPMSRPRDKELITRKDMDTAVCVSTEALGNCTLDTIQDIVYVNPDTFEGDKTQDMAIQISRINAKLAKTNRQFLLAGPGRWGSSDPWLGIPVDWNQISGAGAIVEIRDGAINADASWGSHFFNDITSQGIPYITVNPDGATDRIDLDHLTSRSSCHTVRDEGFIRHMRLNHPLVIKVDGEQSRCVILDAGEKRPPIHAA